MSRGCTNRGARSRLRAVSPNWSASRSNSRTLESFSLEHEDPTRILAALCMLGLDGHANTNYSLGLSRALGLAHATAQR